MKLTPFIYDDVDDFNANTYVISDENNNCVVIDPSSKGDGIINFIKKNKYHLKAILLTHAHFDHIRGVDKLHNEFNADLYVGFEDVDKLKDARENGSIYNGENVVISTEAKSITEGDVLHLLDEDIKVIYTPYHTSGSVSYFIEKMGAVFTGDSLFKMSVGRSDFPSGNPRLMKGSLDKLMRLNDEVKVYPGHGRFTTIGYERIYNPFVK